MTYCVAMLVAEGLVFLSDTRTSAGIDQISTFRKMKVFERPRDRVLVLLSAGNLAITQSLGNVVQEKLALEGPNLWSAPNLFEAARHVGDCLREVHTRDAQALQAFNIEFNASFIFGGQIRGEAPRLFHIYAAGNFIEASCETPYFQIGESKYGKPIIDRVLSCDTPLVDAAKCALISMDSTVKSNLSVGLPLDMICYRRDSLRIDRQIHISASDTYFNQIRRHWGERLREVFAELPAPDWQ